MTMNRLAALHDWPVLSSARGDRRLDRGVQIVGREQDEGVGAAELEHDLLQVLAGQLRRRPRRRARIR